MRKKKAEKRYVTPDPLYNDVVLAKFVNCIMLQGKKTVARKIVYQALNIVGEKSGQEPIEVFRKAIANASPALEVRPRL